MDLSSGVTNIPSRMLAVMTLNLGIFFAVLGGILIGELIFGRFIQGNGGWQEGACHDG